MEILAPRQVAAPASDITSGTVRLPAPGANAVRSHGALFALDWKPVAPELWTAEVTMPVAAGPLGLAIQGAGASGMDVALRCAGANGGLGGVLTDATDATDARRDQALPVEMGAEDVQRWDVVLQHSGAATIVVTSRGSLPPAPTILALRDGQSLVASAHLNSHLRVSDQELTLVAQVEDSGSREAEHGADIAVSSAWADLQSLELGPRRGITTRLRLRDDGRGGDPVAGDGLFCARVPLGLLGSYEARIQLEGSRSGVNFVRTTGVTFTVSDPLLRLTGAVRTKVLDRRRMRIDLEARPLAEARRVQVAAEVWAHDVDGRCRPMAWLSRIDMPQAVDAPGAQWTLPLWLDSGWLSATGLRPPLELRNVRVQDPDHFGVLARVDRMEVPVGALPPMAGRGPVPLSQLFGVSVNASVPTGPAVDTPPVVPNPGLVLCHGYCAGGNPWPNGDFNQPKLGFSDPSRNRSHDAFANLIASQAAGYTSFGVVAHSQGGQAALHLLTYYQSPLDRAQGPRRIQSVGSPYQGTPLASLGFFACGVNDNMTPSGAATWLAGIPSWARAEVFYYTTANDGFACQFLTSLLLSNPEDGTTERSRGQLPGGQNMGHVDGWCHTTGMSDPPQYRDGSRNAVMDVEAAR